VHVETPGIAQKFECRLIATGFWVERVDRDEDRTVLTGEGGRKLEADRVVVLTEFRPDLWFLSDSTGIRSEVASARACGG